MVDASMSSELRELQDRVEYLEVTISGDVAPKDDMERAGEAIRLLVNVVNRLIDENDLQVDDEVEAALDRVDQIGHLLL